MSVKRIDFIAHAYVEEDDVPAGMPLEAFVAGLTSNPALGVAHVRKAEWDECTDGCCTYGDCGAREIPR
jgi:hypothetical protein